MIDTRTKLGEDDDDGHRDDDDTDVDDLTEEDGTPDDESQEPEDDCCSTGEDSEPSAAATNTDGEQPPNVPDETGILTDTEVIIPDMSTSQDQSEPTPAPKKPKTRKLLSRRALDELVKRVESYLLNPTPEEYAETEADRVATLLAKISAENEDPADKFQFVANKLKAAPRWVLYKLVPTVKTDKYGRTRFDKIPYQIDGLSTAKVNDPTTWSTFARAVRAYTDGSTGMDGIGFMLGDGFFGFDWDHVIDPEIGEIPDEVIEYLKESGAWCEVSPSVTGIHGIGFGNLPKSFKRTNEKGEGFEAYQPSTDPNTRAITHGRFFTVTGRHIDFTPDDVPVIPDKALADFLAKMEAKFPKGKNKDGSAKNSRNKECDGKKLSLKDGWQEPSFAELIDMMFAAANGDETKALWEGENHGDPSQADFDFCGTAAWWTGRDPVRMRELLYDSARPRSKWDDRRMAKDGSESTWIECEIEKACRRTVEVHGRFANPDFDPAGSNMFRGAKAKANQQTGTGGAEKADWSVGRDGTTQSAQGSSGTNSTSNSTNSAKRRVKSIRASEIIPVEATYIVEPYIERAELTWLEGGTKEGKTHCMIDLLIRSLIE
jgi:hypothetical protein